MTLPCQLSRVPVVPTLTETEGLAGAPEGAGGVAADEPAGALQLVSRGAAETGVPTRVQAADRDLPESRPCWEGAAQQVGWGQVVVLPRLRSNGTPPQNSETASPEPWKCLGVAGLE